MMVIPFYNDDVAEERRQGFFKSGRRTICPPAINSSGAEYTAEMNTPRSSK